MKRCLCIVSFFFVLFFAFAKKSKAETGIVNLASVWTAHTGLTAPVICSDNDGTTSATNNNASVSANPLVVNINDSNSVYTIASCPFTGNFYDSGGSGANYNDNESFTQTITAPAGQCLSVVFTSFSTENNYDYLFVYDGTSTASTLMGVYTGNTSPGT